MICVNVTGINSQENKHDCIAEECTIGSSHCGIQWVPTWTSNTHTISCSVSWIIRELLSRCRYSVPLWILILSDFRSYMPVCLVRTWMGALRCLKLFWNNGGHIEQCSVKLIGAGYCGGRPSIVCLRLLGFIALLWLFYFFFKAAAAWILNSLFPIQLCPKVCI